MNTEDAKHVEETAELQVRRYFDYFLKNTLPVILKAHTTGCPHGKQVSRVKWALIGAAVIVLILVPTVGRPILSLIFKI